MRILFLAPQPFFQERGTPIAVRLALEVLGARRVDQIDLLTYHEGSEVHLEGVNIHRIRMPRFVRAIGPGISFKKLVCDVVFFVTALQLVWRHRKQQYQVVHAVEESVFMALFIKWLFRIPYLYDMDSSLAQQLADRWIVCKPLAPLLRLFERWAIRSSLAVVPVCDALAVIAEKHGSPWTKVLNDVSLLEIAGGTEVTPLKNLHREAALPSSASIVLYIGNLEPYQGIDLLLQSFAMVSTKVPEAHLVIIGGRADHCQRYNTMIDRLGIMGRAHVLGPRPVSSLYEYLRQATVLVSPRIRGTNTPMKVYSYLHSGIPLVATKLPTHQQVVDSETSFLADPTPVAFAEALRMALQDRAQALAVGARAKILAERKYTFERFQATLNEIYERVHYVDTARSATLGSVSE